MNLSNLPSIITKGKKRVGRGVGSGKGMHTTGRGNKGQKVRNKVPIWFEGGQLPLIRRTPFIKGKNRFKPLKAKPILISLADLTKFREGSLVDANSITKMLRLSPSAVTSRGLKIVVRGKVDRTLKVKIPVSQTAKVLIEAAGGKCN